MLLDGGKCDNYDEKNGERSVAEQEVRDQKMAS